MIIKPVSHKGFVILFAVIISVLMLMLGAGIFSIASKESILSSTSREAHQAFTAADTGAECALYAVASNQYLVGFYQSVPVPCADTQVIFSFDQATTWNGRIELPSLDSCADISITTDLNLGTRTIRSQGYNLCNTDQPQAGNPRLVERVLELTYQVGGGTPTTQNQNITQGGTNNQGTFQQANPFPTSNLPGGGNVPKIIDADNPTTGSTVPDTIPPLKVVGDPCVPSTLYTQTRYRNLVTGADNPTQSAYVSVNQPQDTSNVKGVDLKPGDVNSNLSTSASTDRLSTGLKVNTVCDDGSQKGINTSTRLPQTTSAVINVDQTTEQSGFVKVLDSVSQTFETALSLANEATQAVLELFK